MHGDDPYINCRSWNIMQMMAIIEPAIGFRNEDQGGATLDS